MNDFFFLFLHITRGPSGLQSAESQRLSSAASG